MGELAGVPGGDALSLIDDIDAIEALPPDWNAADGCPPIDPRAIASARKVGAALAAADPNGFFTAFPSMEGGVRFEWFGDLNLEDVALVKVEPDGTAVAYVVGKDGEWAERRFSPPPVQVPS